MTRYQVQTDGIHMVRKKGSLPNIIGPYTPRLRAALADAQGPVKSLRHVLTDSAGQRVTYSAIRSAFVRAMARAGQSGWTIHDIKAKGYTDHVSGHTAAGHRTDMSGVYRRKPTTAGPTR